jgi:hypothetical protein
MDSTHLLQGVEEDRSSQPVQRSNPLGRQGPVIVFPYSQMIWRQARTSSAGEVLDASTVTLAVREEAMDSLNVII